MTAPALADPTDFTRGNGSDSASFRACFGSFATGVLIVTCKPPGEAGVAITINSLSSVSLNPALALFCLEERSATLASFLRAGHFAMNILCRNQAALSNHYAQHHEVRDTDFLPAWQSGAPILKGALAVADCTLHDVYGGGDHRILMGQVLETGVRKGDPLLYYRGGYGSIGDATS